MDHTVFIHCKIHFTNTLMFWRSTSHMNLFPGGGGGGGPLVFKVRYHARVWPLKTDPKQGF